MFELVSEDLLGTYKHLSTDIIYTSHFLCVLIASKQKMQFVAVFSSASLSPEEGDHYRSPAVGKPAYANKQ